MKQNDDAPHTTAKSGISVSTLVLGVIAGAVAGILFAPKSGKETRADIKEALVRVRDDIPAKLAELKEVTGETYHDVVNTVAERYKGAKTLVAEEAGEIKADLARRYDSLKQAAKRSRESTKLDT
jgi:gas vesicle protein